MIQDSQENGSWGARFANLFRERQIYLRSEGQVHFITIRPWMQIGLASLTIIGCAWIAFATINVAFKDQIIEAKKRKFHQMQTAYEDRIAAMNAKVNSLNGRLLLNQDAYEDKLVALKKRQSALKERQSRIEKLLRDEFSVKGKINTAALSKPSDTKGAHVLTFHLGRGYPVRVFSEQCVIVFQRIIIGIVSRCPISD